MRRSKHRGQTLDSVKGKGYVEGEKLERKAASRMMKNKERVIKKNSVGRQGMEKK